jgi:hypothetical protein
MPPSLPPVESTGSVEGVHVMQSSVPLIRTHAMRVPPPTSVHLPTTELGGKPSAFGPDTIEPPQARKTPSSFWPWLRAHAGELEENVTPPLIAFPWIAPVH